MSKWFKDGLDKDELRKEYRRLAKQYHPDINKTEGSTEIMQEINSEYDTYKFSGTDDYTDFWDIIRNIYKRQNERERIVVWMIHDKKAEEAYAGRGENIFIGFPYDEYDWMNGNPRRSCTGDGDEWMGEKSGLHFVECKSGLFSFLLARVSPIKGKDISMPSDEKIISEIFGVRLNEDNRLGIWDTSVDYCRGKMLDINDTRKIHFINSERYGYICYVSGRPEFGKFVTVFSEVDGKVYKSLAKEKWFGKFYVEYETGVVDFYVHHFLGDIDGLDTLLKQFDIDYEPEFMEPLSMVKVEKDYLPKTDSPVVSQLFRKGILRIFRSKMNNQLIFGTIHYAQLMRNLPNISLEDLDDVQDYLDGVNNEFEDRVKGMIRKGKLKIKI